MNELSEWSFTISNHSRPHLRTSPSISKMSVRCLISVASEIFHSFFSSFISGWGRLRCVSQGTGSLLFHASYFLTERELEARSSESQSSLALLSYLWLNLWGKQFWIIARNVIFKAPRKKRKQWEAASRIQMSPTSSFSFFVSGREVADFGTEFLGQTCNIRL